MQPSPPCIPVPTAGQHVGAGSEAPVPSSRPQLPLPGLPLPNRRDVAVAEAPLLALPTRTRGATATYVTDTATTPKQRVPQQQAQAGFLPKWLLSDTSLELQGSFRSSAFSFSVPGAGGPTGATGAAGQGEESFKWVPERVLAPSWHQRLSETYTGYNMVNMIGEGRHGVVFIVQHRSSEKYYACKLLHKRDHEAKALQDEINMLRRLDHPNIVRLHETNEDADSVFLVMELCCGGDLFSSIQEQGSLPEAVACTFAEQMFKALAYCHAMGVVHHDIKPENFLLETEDPDCLKLKLADFGIATSMRPSALAATANREDAKGSIPYMAPERFLRRWNSLVADSKSSGSSGSSGLAAGDAWSSGVVLYVMLSGDLPFGESVDAICSGRAPDFSAKAWAKVSADAVDLILKLLNPVIEDRWTAQQALKHPWFSSQGPAEAEEDVARRREELAPVVVQCLRRWRQFPKLRRIAIAALASRLGADHPIQELARDVYNAFNSRLDKLRCEELVLALGNCSAGAGALPGPEADADLMSSASASARHSGSSSSSLTGLHLRRAVRGAVGRFWREVQPEVQDHGAEAPAGAAGVPAGLPPTDGAEALLSLTELRCLVAALDGAQNGTVDFTLLIAALLSPKALDDEACLTETFGMFDFRKRGGISADDLLTYMSPAVNKKDVSVKRFSEMIGEFDLNDDGLLDIDEFRAMVQGSVSGSAKSKADSPQPL